MKIERFKAEAERKIFEHHMYNIVHGSSCNNNKIVHDKKHGSPDKEHQIAGINFAKIAKTAIEKNFKRVSSPGPN